VALDDAKATVALAKVGSVWGLIGITDWLTFGQAVAALYALAMLVHFVWTHFLRPLAEWMGWIKPKRRIWAKTRVTDYEEPR